MREVFFALIPLVFFGCATTQQSRNFFYDHPELRPVATKLAMDYLNGQLHGESYDKASVKYGNGVSEFYNLQEIQGCEKHGDLYWDPAVECRVKSGNAMGGVTWKDISMRLAFFPYLKDRNDDYDGLRIKSVDESKMRYSVD